MLERMINFFMPEIQAPEPLSLWELNQATVSHTYDEVLPPQAGLRESVIVGDYSTTHKIVLVEQSDVNSQLGYMTLEHLYSNAMWWKYMQDHGVKDLWIDRTDLVSLAPHRGIGTTLWNISHRIIKSGEQRAIIDTSKGWTRGKVAEAQKEGTFTLLDTDSASNYGKSYKRYLVKYN